jgi:3-mercaptopyruvate sulfurtransferase SseA
MFALLMGLKTVAPAALHQLIQGPERVLVVDVNARESWVKARVPGARNLDHRNVRVMSAGISGWLAAKLPTESGD